MPTVKRSDLLKILPAIRQRLTEVLSWPLERVLIADPADIGDAHPQGDAYLCLWIDYTDPNLPTYEGGGRTDTRVTEKLAVCIRTRCGTDNAGEGAEWLVNKQLGHAKTRKDVWNALVAFPPADTSEENEGDWFVTQGIAPADGTRPRREPLDKDWGESTLFFSVSYELDLNQEDQ